YNYDNLGNRDSVEQMLSWTTKKGKEKEKTKIADYTNNSLNQYTSVSSLKRDNDDEKHGNSGKFVYDKNGNLIQDSNQRYSYDYRNRLVKVESYEAGKKWKIETNLIAEFSYDVLGRRIQKTTYNDDDENSRHSELDSESTITKYTYSNQDVLEETSYGIRDGKEKLKDTKEYIYWKGIDDVLVMSQTTINGKKTQTNQYFYQKDQLGSIIAITDQSGKLAEEYKYDEFGKAYTRAGKSDNWKVLKKSDVGNTRLFTGREYDKEIGLYYYRARYYSADLGRFISRDPIGTADNVNLYSYVGNSPVMYVDGMGLEKALMVWNENSIRIIYENSWVWHTFLQIGKYVYTYWTEWDYLESRIKWIWSIIPNLVNAEITSRGIEEFLLFDKDLTIYDLEYTQQQKDNLQAFVNSSINSKDSYSLLWQNCASFVQAGMIASWIDTTFDAGIWWNIPFVYNWYLNELSKWEFNYIKWNYNYNIDNYSKKDQENITNLVEKNYNINVNYLHNISPYVK
ncbi:MAG: YD repeat protein, partial [uncultured bacterium (gcode 4)]